MNKLQNKKNVILKIFVNILIGYHLYVNIYVVHLQRKLIVIKQLIVYGNHHVKLKNVVQLQQKQIVI